RILEPVERLCCTALCRILSGQGEVRWSRSEFGGRGAFAETHYHSAVSQQHAETAGAACLCCTICPFRE
ncbi:hypothetical protein JZ751_019805, partial [Albula glossodonta]